MQGTFHRITGYVVWIALALPVIFVPLIAEGVAPGTIFLIAGLLLLIFSAWKILLKQRLSVYLSGVFLLILSVALLLTAERRSRFVYILDVSYPIKLAVMDSTSGRPLQNTTLEVFDEGQNRERTSVARATTDLQGECMIEIPISIVKSDSLVFGSMVETPRIVRFSRQFVVIDGYRPEYLDLPQNGESVRLSRTATISLKLQQENR